MFSRKFKKLISNPKAYFLDSKLFRAIGLGRLHQRYSLPQIKRNPRLIISMSTFPAREEFAAQTLESILKQTLRPDIIVVWLAEDECHGRNIPEKLVRFKDFGVEFNFVKNTIRSYQKLFFTKEKYPDDVIVTIDDDVIYREDMLELLYISYKKHPYDISCHRAHLIKLNSNNAPLPYKEWKMRISDKTPSYLHLATGVGGVLYPPYCLHPDWKLKEKFLNIAPTCDDLWFWAMEVMNGYKTRVIEGNNSKLVYARGSQNIADKDINQLHALNVEQGANDVQLAAILRAYPQIMKIALGKRRQNINNIINNNKKESSRSKYIPIVFICDESYVMPTVVAITSLKLNSKKDTKYKIYVISDKISEESKERLYNLASENTNLVLINVSSSGLEYLHDTKKSKILSASISALNKFLIPELIQNEDKILYLDSDIIVRKDLSELYGVNIKDLYAAVCFDTGLMYSKKTQSIDPVGYFNSGMMLLNSKKLREEKISERLIKTKENLLDKSLMDQHVLNMVFTPNVAYLNIRYNLLYTNLLRAEDKYSMRRLNELNHSNYKNLADLRKDAVIIHFSSKDKPWMYVDTPLAEEWHKYYMQTSYKNIPLKRIKLK